MNQHYFHIGKILRKEFKTFIAIRYTKNLIGELYERKDCRPYRNEQRR